MPTFIKGIMQMKSPPGTPGAWSIESKDGRFEVLWDGKPSPFGTFDTRKEAEERMAKFYLDNPPVPA